MTVTPFRRIEKPSFVEPFYVEMSFQRDKWGNHSAFLCGKRMTPEILGKLIGDMERFRMDWLRGMQEDGA